MGGEGCWLARGRRRRAREGCLRQGVGEWTIALGKRRVGGIEGERSEVYRVGRRRGVVIILGGKVYRISSF